MDECRGPLFFRVNCYSALLFYTSSVWRQCASVGVWRLAWICLFTSQSRHNRRVSKALTVRLHLLYDAAGHKESNVGTQHFVDIFADNKMGKTSKINCACT